MKFLDVALNAVIVLSVTVFLAYIGLHHYDYGLFTTLPRDIVGFFTGNAFLQYVALVLLIAALIAKIPTGRAITRREIGRRVRPSRTRCRTSPRATSGCAGWP